MSNKFNTHAYFTQLQHAILSVPTQWWSTEGALVAP